jgi:hypothetical protein
MKLVIRYSNSCRSEAVLLAADRQTMRIVAAGERDTEELHRHNDCWYMESGEPVEIESVMMIPGMEAAAFCSYVYPRTMTAGQRLF